MATGRHRLGWPRSLDSVSLLCMRKCLLALGMMVAVVSLVCGQTRRAITHEDVWLMRRVGGPTVSPDGKWAVFSLTEPAYDAKDESSDLWIVEVASGAPPRRITANKPAESGVCWSPDSQKIAFSSKREGDEVSQIYLLNLAGGGEAERITTLSTGARAPRWSPDGRRLLFISDVYPGGGDDEGNKKAAKEHRDRKHNVRVYDGFPIRYWDKWLDEHRAHLFVQDAISGAKAHDLLAGSKWEQLPGFGGKQTDTGEDLPAVWTPDSQSVVFTASVNRDQAAYSETDTDLFIAAGEGGEVQRLTEDADSYGRPVFTPDGKMMIIGVTPGGTGFVYRLKRLARYPWPFDPSKRVLLTAEFDRAPGEPVLSPDGRMVYFTAEDAGLEKIYRVPIDGGEVKIESGLTSGVITNLDGGGKGAAFRLLALWDSAVNPAEIFAFEPGETKPRQLTHFTEERTAALDLFPVEHFWFKNSRGQRIQNLLVRPPGFDPARKYPLLAVFHGGPNLMFRDSFGVRWNYHLLASPGYVVVLTNYAGSTGFGEDFSRAVQGSPLKAPADDVNEAIDEVERRYAFIDGKRLAGAGASYGGHLANWMEATTTRYRCLISHAGLVNLEAQWGTSDMIYDREVTNGGPVWEQGAIWREQNPVRYAANHATKSGWMTPMLLTVGEKDFRVPLNNTLENWSYLQRLRVPSKLLVFPDENHWITKGEDSRYWYGEVQAWLKRWLQEAPPPGS